MADVIRFRILLPWIDLQCGHFWERDHHNQEVGYLCCDLGVALCTPLGVVHVFLQGEVGLFFHLGEVGLSFHQVVVPFFRQGEVGLACRLGVVHVCHLGEVVLFCHLGEVGLFVHRAVVPFYHLEVGLVCRLGVVPSLHHLVEDPFWLRVVVAVPVYHRGEVHS